jgi:hypothetical protein
VRLVGQEVTVKVSAEEVVVFDRVGEVARHARAYGRQQMALDLMHYLPLIERKHRALDRAVPLQQWLEQHGPCFGEWLRLLRQHQGVIEGSKEFVQTLMLCEHHAVVAVTRAVEQALTRPKASLAWVRFFLAEEREKATPVLQTFPYAGPTVMSVSAQSYAALCELVEQGCQESKAPVRIDPGAIVEVESAALAPDQAAVPILAPWSPLHAPALAEVTHG